MRQPILAFYAACLAASILWPQPAFAQQTGGIGTSQILTGEAGLADAAVVVGVEDYVFVSDIAGAADNATDWYKWLRETRGVPQESVALLRNSDATLENLKEALSKASAQVGEGGTLWFVFIGHGAPGQDGKEGVLVGADAQQNPRSLYARSLSQSALASTIAGGKQGRAVLILDTCFSGQDTSGHSLVANLQPLIPTQGAAAPDRTIVLTAAGSDEFAGPLPSTGRPAFSYLMLGALKGWADANGDKAVTVGEAIDYAQHALRVVVTDRSQQPELVGGDRGMVLSTGQTEAAPDLDALKVKPATVAVMGQVSPSNLVGIGVVNVGPPPVQQPIMIRLEVGVRWIGPETFKTDKVEFQDMELGDQSEFVDLALSELSEPLVAKYAGFTTQNNEEGFGWGFSFGFTWTSDTGTTATLTSDESMPDKPALQDALRKGYEARIAGLYLAEMNVEPHYLLRLEPVTLVLGVGFGGQMGGIGVDEGPKQTLTGVSTTTSLIYGWTLPVRAVASMKVYENWAASLIYMYHLMPFDSHTVLIGVGPSYY